LPGQEALARVAERALFDAGFETALLRASGFHSPSLTVIGHTLWSLGILILVVVDDDSPETRSEIESLAPESLFDYSAFNNGSESDDLVGEIVRRAETLRFESTTQDPEKEY
jgi:hypothetical protein